MLKKIALAAALGTFSLVAANNTFKVNILRDSVVAGKQIKAGDYKIALDGNTATLKRGKEAVTVSARTEQAQVKYQNTQVKYVNDAIEEIHIGGSNTKIVFTPEHAGTGGGMN